MITLFITFIIFIAKYEYTKKYYITGYIIIEDDNYYIKTYIKEEKINLIYNDLIFNNNKVNFKVKSLGSEYIFDGNNKYYEVNLEFKLDKKKNNNNNILNMYFKEKKTTLYKEIKRKLKKGLQNEKIK